MHKGQKMSEKQRENCRIAKKWQWLWSIWYWKGKKMSDELRKKLSNAHKWLPSSRKWKKNSPETRAKISKANKWKIWPNIGRKFWPMSEECKYKISIANKWKRKPEWFGKKWKDSYARRWGITPESLRIRHSLEVKLRRRSVFERDNFTCQKCKYCGGRLNAHHINNFSEFPELRTSIENGITLCKDCHQEFHNMYWRRNNTKEQFYKFSDNNL